MVTDLDGNGEVEVLSFIKDRQNSVKVIMNEKGEAIQEINYSAYGETQITERGQIKHKIPNAFYYTSRELEPETGDYFYRARFYDPRAGRFLSEDPIGFKGGDSNVYRYVLNNPLILTDPTGNNPFAMAGAVAGGIIGGITSGSQSSASCFLGAAADTAAGVITGAVGGFFLGFGIPTPGIVGGGAIAVGGSVAGLGPAAIGIFGSFGSSFCPPPPPPPPAPSCGES